MAPKYTLATYVQLTRVLARMSPYYQEGRWTIPEAALGTYVISLFIAETIEPFAYAYRHGRPVPRFRPFFQQELAAVSHWSALIGLPEDTPYRMLRDLDIPFTPREQAAAA